MDQSLRGSMATIRLLVAETLGAGQPVQPVGRRRSLLGGNGKLSSEDTLFCILEVLDDYEARAPRRVFTHEEAKKSDGVGERNPQ